MKDFQSKISRLQERDAFRSFRCSPERAGCRLMLEGQELINFSSNDYLDLSNHPEMIEAVCRAVRDGGCSAAASRLISGNLALYDELEAVLAADYAKDKALVFPSGYAANTGMLSALLDRHDTVFSDRLNHASLLDGISMSGASLKRFPHLDYDALEDMLRQQGTVGHRFVVTDTVFSMDGDRADLLRLTELCSSYDAFLIIDEAHANGVFGTTGLGLAELSNTVQQIPLIMGTFSKGLGSFGGFVAGDAAVIDFLINRARSLIYTTGLPPAVLAANLKSLELARGSKERRETVHRLSAKLRNRLDRAGINTLNSDTQIIPVIAGSNRNALDWSAYLFEKGILALPVRPPTVPEGTARIRISVCAGHTDAEIDMLSDCLIELYYRGNQ